jgi:hypothetical protein
MADTNSRRFNDCGVICFGGVKPTDTHQMLFSPPIRGPTSPWQAGRLPQNTAIGEGPEWVNNADLCAWGRTSGLPL